MTFKTMEEIMADQERESQVAKDQILQKQLTGEAPQDMSPYIAGSTTPRATAAQTAAPSGDGGAGATSALAAGGTTLATTGNPYLAGAMVGGQLLAQSMANQAQAEQARRQRAIEIANQHSAGERQGIDQMLSAWRGALR